MLDYYSYFKKLVATRFLHSLALQMQSIILGWQMYVLTHDPLFLGLIGLAEALPALSLALFSGYLVDRSNPLKILRWVVALGFFSALILWGSHLPWIHLAHHTQILALFISSFLVGIGRSFLHPAVYSLVPQLVDRDRLSKAAAWGTSAYQLACISGPALGGLLFGSVGIFYTSSIICVLLLIALIPVLLIHFTPAIPKPTTDTLLKELLSGAHYVFKHRIMLPALTLDMISVLFGGVTALLPIYAAEILYVGPLGLGILRAAPAIGASTISLALTRIEIKKNAGTWLLGAVSGFGLCILLFALSQNYILSLVVLAFSGAFDSVSAVIRGTIVQLASPESLRGRISSVNMVFISSSNELGEFESGIAASLLGTVPAAVFGGVICLFTVAATALFCPKLRGLNLQDLHTKELT